MESHLHDSTSNIYSLYDRHPGSVGGPASDDGTPLKDPHHSGSNHNINNLHVQIADCTLIEPSLSRPTRGLLDGGWGWMVVFCSSCMMAIIGSSYTTFSLCYTSISDTFDTSKGVTGWVMSLYLSTGNFLGIFFSLAVIAHGSRSVCLLGCGLAGLGWSVSYFATNIIMLYISIGICSGLGIGMIILSSVVIVQQYFDKRRALAGGMAAAGFSLGSLSVGPLVQIIIERFTWRGAFLIQAAAFLQIAVCACAFRPQIRPSLRSSIPGIKVADISEKKPETIPKCSPSIFRRITGHIRAAFDFSLLRYIPFSLYLASQFLVHFGIITFYQITPSRAKYLGISDHLVAILPVVSGSATGVSRVVFSAVANSPCIDRLVLQGVASLLASIMHSTTFLATDFTTIVVYNALEGIFIGCSLCVISTIMVDLLGVEHIARAQALLSISLGSSLLISTPFAGFLFDLTGNYDVGFLVMGILHLSGAICAILAVYIRHNIKKTVKTLDIKE